MRRAGHIASMGETKNAYKMFVGKPEGKRPLSRSWEDNIKIDLKVIGCECVCVDCTHLLQDIF
jgi:hypothetical protein